MFSTWGILLAVDEASRGLWSPRGLALVTLSTLAAVLLLIWLQTRYIPHSKVGIVVKLWSAAGAVPEGCIIALNGEAGYQAKVLRGGIHTGLWRWQYCIRKVALVTIPQGK